MCDMSESCTDWRMTLNNRVLPPQTFLQKIQPDLVTMVAVQVLLKMTAIVSSVARVICPQPKQVVLLVMVFMLQILLLRMTAIVAPNLEVSGLFFERWIDVYLQTLVVRS